MSYKYGYNARYAFGPTLTPMVRVILYANIAVYILLTIDRTAHTYLLDRWISLIPVAVIYGWQVWRLVTYMFMHGPLMHILFNMFIFWMFGPEIEKVLGSKRFLKYYFFTGIGAGLCSLLVSPNSPYPIEGASGAIFALLFAFALYFPNRMLLLFFVIPIKAKYLIAGLVVMETVLSVSGVHDGIAHFAHVGGIIFGYIFLKHNTMIPDLKYSYLKLKGWWIRRKFKAYTSSNKNNYFH